VRFFRFDGDREWTGERFNAVKDIWVEHLTVPRLIETAQAVLEQQIRTFSALGADGKFYTAPEYPESAWYEAIVNACVHRSYGNGLKNMHTTIKMFDDRLEIESPGPFPPFVTPTNIYGQSHPRNPVLMHAMRFMRFVKMAGEGTRRMRDTMKAAELPAPEFSEKQIDWSRVRVVLRNNIHLRKTWVDTDAVAIVGAALAARLEDDEKRILNFIAENGTINVTQAVRITQLAWETAKAKLDRLAAMQILEHIHRPDIERDSKAHYRLKTPPPLRPRPLTNAPSPPAPQSPPVPPSPSTRPPPRMPPPPAS
jgi:ATP-dependent DNA helicase RecG